MLCLIGMATYRDRRVAVAVLVCSILINCFLYLGFRRLQSQSPVYAIIEKDLGNYTLDAVKHVFVVMPAEIRLLNRSRVELTELSVVDEVWLCGRNPRRFTALSMG